MSSVPASKSTTTLGQTAFDSIPNRSSKAGTKPSHHPLLFRVVAHGVEQVQDFHIYVPALVFQDRLDNLYGRVKTIELSAYWIVLVVSIVVSRNLGPYLKPRVYFIPCHFEV